MFTFLMCVNKQIPYLDEAIDSMVNQEYEKEYEIFIIANNCDESLWEYLQKKNIEHNRRLVLYRTNIGQLAFNLNFGVNFIKSEYIVRMDADDISELNRLKKLEEFIFKSGYPDVVGSAASIIDENGELIESLSTPLSDSLIKKSLSFKNSFIHPSTAIKRSALLKVKGYANGLNSEDYDLWLRMARAGFIFANSPEPLVRYRINPHQIKGSRLAYAESTSHIFREFILTGKPQFFFGLIYNILKYIFKHPFSK